MRVPFILNKCTHLLMLLPSLSLSPAAPVLDTRSLPARSTRLILLTFSPEFCLPLQHEKVGQENKFMGYTVSVGKFKEEFIVKVAEKARKDWPQTVDHKEFVWQWYWRRHVIDCSPHSCWWLQLCEICSPLTLIPQCPKNTEWGHTMKRCS